MHFRLIARNMHFIYYTSSSRTHGQSAISFTAAATHGGEKEICR